MTECELEAKSISSRNVLPEMPVDENTVSQAVDCNLVEDICSDTRMTRSEFIAQLDSLKLHGFRVLWVGGLSFMLITWPLAFHSFALAGRQSRRASLAFNSIAFGIAVLTFGCFYLVLRRTIAKYSPACSSCGRKITWREKNKVLNSGQCPHCNVEIFDGV